MTHPIELILGSLEVGLPEDSDREIQFIPPPLLPGLPPKSVRAIVLVDQEPFEVFIKAVEPGEAHEPEVNHE